MVKGGAGVLTPGLTLTESTTKFASAHNFKKAVVSSSVAKRFDASAFISVFTPLSSTTKNDATTLNEDSGTNDIISLSRSTIRRTATD